MKGAIGRGAQSVDSTFAGCAKIRGESTLDPPIEVAVQAEEEEEEDKAIIATDTPKKWKNMSREPGRRTWYALHTSMQDIRTMGSHEKWRSL